MPAPRAGARVLLIRVTLVAAVFGAAGAAPAQPGPAPRNRQAWMHARQWWKPEGGRPLARTHAPGGWNTGPPRGRRLDDLEVRSSVDGRLNAMSFGAVGDGRADDTAALQRAIDAAQRQGKQLFVPGGSYALSKPLLVHCCNEWCQPQGPSPTGHHLARNFSGLDMSGAGMYETHLFAKASAPRLESILHFESHAIGDWAKGKASAQPAFNVTASHQITDLHLGGGATAGWQRDMGWTSRGRWSHSDQSDAA